MGHSSALARPSVGGGDWKEARMQGTTCKRESGVVWGGLLPCLGGACNICLSQQREQESQEPEWRSATAKVKRCSALWHFLRREDLACFRGGCFSVASWARADHSLGAGS